MTINVHCPRLGDRERRLFELISSMYPGAPWYKHIAIVWTRCYSVMANQIENWKPERKEGFKRFIDKYFGKEVSKEKANAIPQYFVDSIEARQNNNSSYNELCHLLAWAGQLTLIKDDLPQMKVKLGAPKIEERNRTEYGSTWSVTEKYGDRRYKLFGPKKTRTITYQKVSTIYEERIKQQFTDGSVEYTDWKEVRRDTQDKKI